MKTKMTRKRALELLEKEFGDDIYVPMLCIYMPNELRDDFEKYWKEINTEHHMNAHDYFFVVAPSRPSVGEITTLRLLTAFFFIEDTYK